MAKRQASIDALVAEIKQLDSRRSKLVSQFRQATDKILSGENPFPFSAGRRQRGRKPGRKTGRRKGFKMSKAARAKISAAQKARWAKQKKTS